MIRVSFFVALLMCLSCPTGRAAEDTDPATAALLLKKLEAMEQRISQLESEVTALREENQRLQTSDAASSTPSSAPSTARPAVAATASTAQSAKTPATEVEKPHTVSTPSAAAPAVARTPAAEQAKAEAAANLPVDKIPANVPKGYIPVFGTQAYVKFSLIAQADVLVDSTNANSPGEFITSALPVFGQADYGGGLNSTVSFRQSTLAFNGILETGQGPLSIVYANNFFANANTSQYGYYLLNFYGEWQGLRIGYGYSAFTDADVIPATLDYEGPNSLLIDYNAQIRYTRTLLEGEAASLYGKISIEEADPSLANASANQRLPDTVMALGVKGETWHVQTAGLLSSFSAQTSTGTSDALGWGLSLTGSWSFTPDDLIMGWANFGSGYANYIQDAYGLGLDGYVDSAGNLQTFEAWGFGAGYTHNWSDALSSTFTVGYVDIDDSALLGLTPPMSTVMRQTYYASGNLVWQILPHLTIGAELLYGRKNAVNGADGDAVRFQFTSRYSFNP